MTQPEADYLIIGGGLTGCVVASRLSQDASSPKVILLEAGPDASSNPDTHTLSGAFKLGGSPLDWQYKTLPDPNTAGRTHTITAGKVLGGGSVLNYGSWLRGDKSDYDDWATVVGDDRWSHEGQLMYLKKVEDFAGNSGHGEHGVGGPMHVVPISADENRVYGLRQPLVDAWGELGVKPVDEGSGSTLGISEMLENFRDGKRQPAHQAWDLSKVEVVTNALAQQICFVDGRATEVVLADGRRFATKKEIVLAAGTFATPQLLMLSGVGPQEMLAAHGISIVVSAPEVGKNMIDHFSLVQYWKLRNSEKGLAMGNPLWLHPAYAKGLPADWIINESVPAEQLRVAFEADGLQDAGPLLQPGRCHLETMTMYAAFGSPAPSDGSIISTAVTLMLPTSRGSVSVSSANIADPPQIATHFYSTNADRATLIYGARRLMKALLETAAGKEYVEAEGGFPGMSPLSLQSTDAEIDERIRKTGMAQAHSVGTVAMGKVVDSQLRVKGVQGLRVVDGSVLPVPIGGHPQATLYALAEQAADIILGI